MAKLPTRLNSALLPLGVVALVAGCGGGSMVSNGSGSTYVPPGTTVPSGTAKATLTLYVPPRRGSAAGRSPQYVSPGTSTVTVSVFPAGAPSPWPLPTSTSVPTPGPVPSGVIPTAVPVTMTVNAPLGNAQFFVNTYDGNGVLLSGALSSPVPISPTATNSVNLTLNASAQCTQINHAKGGGGGGAFSIYPMANQPAPQSATFTVTPCDIDGYVIPAGQQLANALTFTTVNPRPPTSVGRTPQAAVLPTPTPLMVFSPSQITTGGDTVVTVSYVAGTHASASEYLVPFPTTSSPTAQYGLISADPVSEILISNQGSNSVTVLREDNGGLITSLGSVPTDSTPTHIVGNGSLSGCAQAGQAAVTTNSDTIDVLTVPLPPAINVTPSPMPNVTKITNSLGTFSTAAISGCTVYVGENGGGYLGQLSSQMTSYARIGGTYAGGTISAIGALTHVYLGFPTANLFDATTNLSTGAFPSADAIAPFDATHVAVAFHSGGYLHFGLWDGTSLSHDFGTLVNLNITAMAPDTNGNVYAIGSYPNNVIFDYVPATPNAIQNSLYGLYPSAIAVDHSNHVLVTDTNGGVGNGTLDVYNYFPSVPTRYSVGINPSGVTVVP